MAIISRSATPLLVRIASDHPPERLSAAMPAYRYAVTSPTNGMATPVGRTLYDNTWHRLIPATPATVHPWDAAHVFAESAAAGGQPYPYVEPDFMQQSVGIAQAINAAARTASPSGSIRDYDGNWPPVESDKASFDWHLGTEFSQLRDARKTVGDLSTPRRVRVGHLDTGYSDPTRHETCPIHIRADMGWNFVENIASAIDPANYSGFLENKGHGTATLALLAGNMCSVTGDFLGGAPFAEVVPVRVANSVVQWETSAVADAIQHVLGWSCDVISMSMGGLPTQRWADEVNAAYDAGCVYCAAAGNSIGGLPTHYMVYPARFRRVIAVSGVTFSRRSYFDYKFAVTKEMEGNYGPDQAMIEHAMASYTPNIAWAVPSTQNKNQYSWSGAGTSSCTPQVAAAAALYMQANLPALLALPGWQRVEAVRNALFTSAKLDDKGRFGNGWLQAAEALKKPVFIAESPTPKDVIDFALFKVLFGWDDQADAKQNMLAVEAAQLVSASGDLQDSILGTDQTTVGRSPADLKAAVDALANSPGISQTLRTFLITAKAGM